MTFDELPPSQSHRLLPLGESRIETRDGQPWLIVTGEAPCANMEVALHPYFYIERPDWWSIELVGNVPGGFCLEAITPYTVARPLRGITGHKGITVVGADETRNHAIQDD